MGIKGFLKKFKSKLKLMNNEYFRGKRVGIDGFVWLHKSVYSGLELATNKTGTKYVSCFMKMIDSVKEYGGTPVVVFDGGRLPIKVKEESKRTYCREKVHELALQTMKTDQRKALMMLTSCIPITHDLVKNVIERLKKDGVEYYVSPYESDAQLAYLDKIGYIDCVITEDSDLCAYGVREIAYKFDPKYKYFYLMKSEDVIKDFDDYDQFLEFCILSGCDFFKMERVGINTAQKLIKKWKSFICIPIQRDEVVNTRFFFAKYTFLNQTVYSPVAKKMVSLDNVVKVEQERISKEIEKKVFKIIEEREEINKFVLGKKMDEKVTKEIVEGVIDPFFANK